MSKKLLTFLLAVAATVLLSFGLFGCGLFPDSPCDHSYKVTDSKDATCTADGYIVRKCKKCGYEKKETLPRGHDYVTLEWESATCTEDGHYIKKCSSCGNIDTGTLPKGHKYDVTLLTATCTEEGVEVKECKVCHDRVETKLEALGHYPVPIGNAVTPTCTQVGLTEGKKCNRCGLVLEEQQELPKEHSLDANLKCKYCGVIFKKYNVTFDMDNGSESVMEEYIHGSKLEFPTAPTKPDHVFIGWYIDDDKCAENYEVSKAVTIVAKYAPIVKISDAAGLMAIAEHPDGYYKLTADINMRGEALPTISEFSGMIDGDGHSVVDAILTANAVEAGDYYGFIGVNTGTVKDLTFGRIGYSVSSYGGKYSCKLGNTWGVITGCNKGNIENVDLLNSTAMLAPTAWTVSASVYFGCIAGVNEGNITGCDITADISSDAHGAQGDYTARTFNVRYGGVAGVNNGVIEECSYCGTFDTQMYPRAEGLGDSAMRTYSHIGGIAGDNTGENAKILKCYVESTISAKTSNFSTQISGKACDNTTLGGVAGVNSDGARVEECSALGAAGVDVHNVGIAGGVIGENTSTGRAYACHASVDVYVRAQNNSDVGYAGGLIGKNSAIAQKCYSTGDVTSVNKVSAGGFVGGNMSGGTVRYSYVTGSTTANKDEKLSLGNYGYFAGLSESASVTYECRYLSSAVVMSNGDYVQQSGGTGNNVPKSIAAKELWAESFLSEQLNWDTGDGWIVFNDNNPLLAWELQRGHDFESKVIAPTHEYGGYTAYRCSDCGRLYMSNYTKPLGHDYEFVRTVAPTCTEQGYDIMLCQKDGCDLDGRLAHINFTPATGHRKADNAQPISTETAPTCGAAGIGEYACSECGQSFTAEMPATGDHDWVHVDEKEVVACTKNLRGEEGYSSHKYCSVCGLTDGKTVTTPHVDANRDNVCDLCKGFTFSVLKESDFIKISDAEGLFAIGNDLSGNYMLAKDIDLTGVEWNALGSKSEPFTGLFYGNNHKIIGLTANVDGVSGTAAEGLFRYNSGKIIGVTLSGFVLNAQNSDVVFGGIAAYNNGEILDCVIEGDNYLQYFANKQIVSSNSNSSRSFVFTLTAGGFAGVNGAGGHVVGCSITGSVVSKNAVYGEIMLNVGNSFWTAGGSVLGNIVFSTQLNVVQNVTFGGMVGMNSGEVSDCKVTGSVNVYSYAAANLVQLKGKLNVKTELYAGSLIGYNTGSATGNSAAAISYEIPSEYKHIGIPYVLPGSAYELTYEIVNHGDGGNGKIGYDAN